MYVSRYFIFIVIALTILLAAISSTSVAVAFPVIVTSFDTSLVLAGWVLTVNQVVAVVSMPLAGKASDIFGKKNAFLAAILFFTIGSLLCAVAPNIQLLIAFRVLQGIGYGAVLPVATGIIAETFPKSRQQLIGLFTSIFPVGQIIGPNLGGWLVSAYNWRSVFWFNVPMGIVALIATIILLKSGKKEKGSMDLVGAGWLAGGIVALLVGLSFIGNTGAVTTRFSGIGLIIIGIVFLIVFMRHVNRAKEPIIDREVLRGRPFVAANIYNIVYGAAIFGVASFIPLYAVSVYGMSTFESGFIMTPRSIATLIASVLTSFSLLRWGYRRPMIVGTLLVAFSLIMLGLEFSDFTVLGVKVNSMTIVIGILLLTGIGMGTASPASNNACIDLMPHRVAAITGVRGMFRQIGGAFSIAILTVLLDSVGSRSLGFAIGFIGMAVIALAAFPLIFIMPRGPEITADEIIKNSKN